MNYRDNKISEKAAAKTEVARVYRRSNSKVKDALSFKTKKDKPKLT